jgi:hypothetical protein
MKLRFAIAVVAVSMLFAACGRFFIVKDKFDATKKVALVQYAINPAFLLGYPNSDDAKLLTATQNIATFQKQMANVFEVVPADAMQGNAGYSASGKPSIDHWYSAKGMRFFDEDQIREGGLPPDVAKKLCADLGVDAVVTITESWGQPQVSWFKGTANNTYYVNAYDKDGTKIWTDAAFGHSNETFGVPPGGVIASDNDNWQKVQGEAFNDALAQFKGRLGK